MIPKTFIDCAETQNPHGGITMAESMTYDQVQRYKGAIHAMQTGVKLQMSRDGVPDLVPGETSCKHLRVGVNSAMCSHAALAELLIAKGIITHAEYFEAVTVMAEKEHHRYEQKLGVKLA